jgi:hypothetical protein
MLCSRVRDLLADYSVQILDRRTQHEVASHLELCADCRQELRVLEGVVALVEEHGFRQPPVALFNGVRNRIESGEVVRERAPWWAWMFSMPARAAAMGVAVAAVALSVALPTGNGGKLPTIAIHQPSNGMITSTANNELAGSIRQHALSAGEGPLTDRVAWEALAQIVSQERPVRAGVP